MCIVSAAQRHGICQIGKNLDLWAILIAVNFPCRLGIEHDQSGVHRLGRADDLFGAIEAWCIIVDDRNGIGCLAVGLILPRTVVRNVAAPAVIKPDYRRFGAHRQTGLDGSIVFH